MNNYVILTDAAADLLSEQVEKYELRVMPMMVHVGSDSFPYRYGHEGLDLDTFYRRLREGETSGTSAVNPSDWEEAIEAEFRAGRDVLIIAFSSALSSTCANAFMAAETMGEKDPERKVLVVDSLSADFGEGMLVCHAAENRLSGMSLEDNAAWVEANRLQQIHWFTVDDLHYLRRGGRISATTAVVGSALGIKPVLHVDNEGRLINVGKARGRKKALKALMDKIGETAINPKEQTMFISHGGCLEEVQEMAREIQATYGVKDVVLNFTGPIAGAHSGPGTVALFFVGTVR